MLFRLLAQAVYAALLLLILVIVALFLSGCSTYRGPPCQTSACDDVSKYRQDRDPFPLGPISYGSIFGPQGNPGKVTVEN